MVEMYNLFQTKTAQNSCSLVLHILHIWKSPTQEKKGSENNCKITDLLRLLSLVDRCVWMIICKHGCDVLDSWVFLRILESYANLRLRLGKSALLLKHPTDVWSDNTPQKCFKQCSSGFV